ncbi:MAG: DUF4178 domain-containing protein [Cocleimonas sp.]|nr:DUF4178 domain-containing protein [Cocleimonas sp.]
MNTHTINCPQCGSDLPLTFRYSKLMLCDHCGSSLFLEDDAVRFAGKQSILPEYPSLLQLKQTFSYLNNTYLPVGHIRYDYEKGFWDEWWVIDNSGEGVWVTVDEGDFAFEREIEPPSPLQFQDLRLDTMFDGWLVTERGHATCEGFEGELPKIVTIGASFDYVDLSKRGGKLFSLEFSDQGIKAAKGIWVDPFEIKVDE